jgi:thioredoxin reductase (NADPH)
MQDKIFANSKIKCIWNSEVQKITGENKVERIEIKNNIDETTIDVKIDGIFIAIGTSPVSDFVKELVSLDEEGYIISTESSTSCDGIFAAGDVVSGSLKQAVFAAGQGAVAAKQVERYLW